MHELSLIENVLKIVAELACKEKLVAVTVINLQIGALRQVMPEYLEFAFKSAAKNTVAEGAALNVKIVQVRIHCNICKYEFVCDELTYFCPKCGVNNLSIISGKELIIESIEGERK